MFLQMQLLVCAFILKITIHNRTVNRTLFSNAKLSKGEQLLHNQIGISSVP